MHKNDKFNLTAILEAIEKIEKFTAEFDNADDFYNNDKSFDASIMNFIVIGEMVTKITADFKMENAQIDWTKIKDFRNLVAHNYFGIDADEVWQIISNKLPELKKEIKKLLDKV